MNSSRQLSTPLLVVLQVVLGVTVVFMMGLNVYYDVTNSTRIIPQHPLDQQQNLWRDSNNNDNNSKNKNKKNNNNNNNSNNIINNNNNNNNNDNNSNKDLDRHDDEDEDKEEKKDANMDDDNDDGEDDDTFTHRLAGLSCEAYGGPSNPKEVEEMIYWRDIPSDSSYQSPYFTENSDEQYLTFEPDGGGWNNIRMAMETVVVMAHSMGRTLVMPPEQKMYLLGKNSGAKQQKVHFSFADFFHLDSLDKEHGSIRIISMEEFLQRTAMRGLLVNTETGRVEFPPGNRTNWNGLALHEKELYEYLRRVTHVRNWKPTECLAVFLASTTVSSDSSSLDENDRMEELRVQATAGVHNNGQHGQTILPVDAPAEDRLREALTGRKKFCVYDKPMRSSLVVHFMCYHKQRARLLTHFYSFLWFEDWHQDLWTKRFVRDHLRYLDELQCAAARVVAAIRQRSRQRQQKQNNNSGGGEFDSFHVRRGDFQYKMTRVDAQILLENSKDQLTPQSTLYIATDERDKSFFDPLRQWYDVCFLDDFMDQIKGLNTNYYGMVDQLVASKGRIFFGTYHSTFTGYINRIRGYHNSISTQMNDDDNGGVVDSYYFVPETKKFAMRTYASVKPPFYDREFPIAWRDIDHDVVVEDDDDDDDVFGQD